MEREAFLNRVATRLGRTRQTSAPERPVRGVPDFYRAAPYGEGVTVDRIERFGAELTAIGGHLQLAATPAETGALLRALLDELAPRTIVTWGRQEFCGWEIDWLWEERDAISFVPGAGLPNPEVRAAAQIADVGVTVADFAVANTGTLALATTAQRARSVSLLPTVHIALVRESQFVDRMGEALEGIARQTGPPPATPSSVHFISGPSRSADIENDLSIGVHGPAALYVIALRGS